MKHEQCDKGLTKKVQKERTCADECARPVQIVKLWSLLSGFFFLAPFVLLGELLDAACGVHEFHLARVERV